MGKQLRIAFKMIAVSICSFCKRLKRVGSRRPFLHEVKNRLLLKSGASPIGDGSTNSPRARQLDGARPEPVEGCEFQKRSNEHGVGDGV